MDAKAFVRTVLLLICLVLVAPAVIWLVTTTSLATVALASTGLLIVVLFSLVAYSFRWRFWAWFLGAAAVLLTPGLLKLGGLFIQGHVRTAMEAWIYVYAAGAVGGLVVELIRGRGGLEFPSADAPPFTRMTAATAIPQPASNGGESVPNVPAPALSTTAEAIDPPLTSPVVTAPATAVATASPSAMTGSETAPQNGAGPDGEATSWHGRIDIGFLSRVTMGGIAAAAALVVVRIIAGDTHPSDFHTAAFRLETLAGAALVGMIAPALWTGTQTVIESRFSFLKGTMDTAGVAVANAEQAVRAARDAGLASGPEASQFIVDAAPLRSPEFIAAIAREADPTEVGKMLLARINSSRIDVGTAQALQEAHLGQALGSLETAERVLRSASQRTTRR